MSILSFFSKHRKFRFTRDVSRCIVDIDVHKRATLPRSSVITVAYLPPCFFHRDSSSRDIRCEVADRCADTMNPDVAASSRELRKRSVLSVVESLSHLNVHYVWPRAFF
ncbi:hypothetical protein AVEN_24968-1 [Araneus ventricosus]|uniref:Uncharacterized protein n=1 Tax=Araneus ventricosus TaxID=182803 RepID=A0A4Y2TV55_ARAVE|nr:hypothetical protein AVEN_24968-1 [Araneus ventricosus]